MSPAETQIRIEELTKATMTNLWMAAALQKIEGNKFPSSPEAMWGEQKAVEMSDQTLVASMKALAASLEAEKRPKRRRSETIHKPE